MDTTTINATILGVSEFFADLAIPRPDFGSKDSLEEFKAAQDANFEEALSAFQKARTAWAKENLKLYQIESSKNAKEEAILEQKAVVAEFRVPFDRTFWLLLVARGREEVARALPQALFGIEPGEGAPHEPSARFVLRQLEITRAYLKIS